MNGASEKRWLGLWRVLRSLTGDDRYERYLAHLAAHHPGEPPPSRAGFYAGELERRWNKNGPTRCC